MVLISKDLNEEVVAIGDPERRGENPLKCVESAVE